MLPIRTLVLALVLVLLALTSRAQNVENVVIVGSGPAGLTAAIYAARANLKPLCIEGPQPGGQLTITTDLENYPGFSKPLLGPLLMKEFRKQSVRFAARLISETVVAADLSKRPFTLELSDGQKLLAKALIVATGASAKWIGLPSEKKFMGKGVSACATCDGLFFKNKDIVVVGGGDTALEEALYLTRFAKTVTIVHRSDKLRASKIMQDRAFKNPKIKVIWDSEVTEILGDKRVSGVILNNVKEKKTQKLPVQGVFVAIGYSPNASVFKPALKTDEAGYIVTEPGTTLTNVPGVFAAGDVADPKYRQAVTAAASGCMAAMDMERFLEEEEALRYSQ